MFFGTGICLRPDTPASVMLIARMLYELCVTVKSFARNKPYTLSTVTHRASFWPTYSIDSITFPKYCGSPSEPITVLLFSLKSKNCSWSIADQYTRHEGLQKLYRLRHHDNNLLVYTLQRHMLQVTVIPTQRRLQAVLVRRVLTTVVTITTCMPVCIHQTLYKL